MASRIELIFGIALPALLSLAALLSAWPPFGTKRSSAGRWWGAPIGVALATSVAACGLVGFPFEKPASPALWLSPFIVLSGLAGVFVGWSVEFRSETEHWTSRPPFRYGLFSLLFGLLLVLSIEPLITSGSIASVGEGVRVGMALLLLGNLLAAGVLQLGRPPGSGGSGPIVPAVLSPLVLFMVTVTTSILLVLSGIISLAILCGALAAALGPAAVGALIRRDLDLGDGAKLTVALVLSGLLAQGFLFGEMLKLSGALLATAPAFAVTQGAVTGAKGALFRIFAVAVVLGASIALAAQAYFA